MMESFDPGLSARELRKMVQLEKIMKKQEAHDTRRKALEILQKDPLLRSPKDLSFIERNPRIIAKTEEILRRERQERDQKKEVFDSEDELERKARILAEVIKQSKSLTIYTGAGISTAADIPDYRGPTGLWTLSQRGESVTNPLSSLDLTKAKPTFTHMALVKLQESGFLKHIVSQNCDGLHVRSGFPRTYLSEIHGNMFLEVCPECEPNGEFFRSFDVTEKTRWRRHSTGRYCHHCKAQLKDTIVLFGEKSRTEIPMRWGEASASSAKADVVICLGSSLQVLKDYPTLWNPNFRLFIVNLQWTPKDSVCELKIHGRCDDVMRLVMSHLQLEPQQFCEQQDPLLALAVPLKVGEYRGTESAGAKNPGWFGAGLKTLTVSKDKGSQKRKRKIKKDD